MCGVTVSGVAMKPNKKQKMKKEKSNYSFIVGNKGRPKP